MVSLIPVGAAPGSLFVNARNALIRNDLPDPELPQMAK